MADATLLQLLSGADPLAAQMLAASQGQALTNASLDPSFGHNEGLFGALAKTIAGIRGGGMTNDAVQQIVAQRQAALPELAKLLASDNPFQAAASGNVSPGALAQFLAGQTPEGAAATRKALAAAQLGELDVAGWKRAQAQRAGIAQPADAGAGGLPQADAGTGIDAPAGGISSPASKKAAPPPARAATPTASLTSAAGLTDGRAPAASTDIASSIGTLPEAQQTQALASLSPQDRAKLVADLAAKLRGKGRK
jgi:hypothetical protein